VSHALFVPTMQLAPLVQAQPASSRSVTITGDEAHHALRVKRLLQGDTVQLCDGAGLAAQGHIASTRKIGKVGWELVVIVSHVQCIARAQPRVHVYACVPKGDLLEHMVDQLSQCGVERFVPLLTSRSVSDGEDVRRARLERICEESLKQCGRAWLLEIGEPANFASALAKPHVIIADATGVPSATLGRITASDDEPICILIGPEGGFTPSELALAQSHGVKLVRCGPHVLRIETAAVVMAGLLMAGLGMSRSCDRLMASEPHGS
jgi:16S rRNA (uracil1498-N3)-methyltransferase